MIIKVTYGKGSGETELSAFDAALWDAGIANYNLIALSSIIPPNSKVIVNKLTQNEIGIGNKVWVVLSKCIEKVPNKLACAGLGWITKKNGTGVFMEENGNDETEVKEKLRIDLESVIKYRKGKFNSSTYQTEKIKCINKPVCAVVAAIYKSEGWK